MSGDRCFRIPHRPLLTSSIYEGRGVPAPLYFFKGRVVKVGKWTCELIFVGLLMVIGLGVWWFAATQKSRKASAEYERLVNFANRQAVEIAIIKQAAELQKLRAATRKAQQPLPVTEEPKTINHPNGIKERGPSNSNR